MLAEKHPSFMLVFDHTGVRAGDATVTTAAQRRASRVHRARRARRHRRLRRRRRDRRRLRERRCARRAFRRSCGGRGINESQPRDLLRAAAAACRRCCSTRRAARATSRRCAQLVAFRREHPEVVMRDLAWMRLRPWQDMIAAFFDDDPDLVARALHDPPAAHRERLRLRGALPRRLAREPAGLEGHRPRRVHRPARQDASRSCASAKARSGACRASAWTARRRGITAR